MIDDYRALAIFVAIADAGSFSAAGRRLKLSTSVVSHHLSKLESRLGVPLFFRSTRSLSLTSEGQRMIGPARRMVGAGEEAIDALAQSGDQPVGSLRITLPAFGDRSDIHRAIWDFARAHPMVSLSVQSSDQLVDLVREGYDLAVRLGLLRDSALKSRRIGTFERRLVAAPDFLANHAPITRIDDLLTADFISYAMLSDTITLVRDGEEVDVTPGRLRVEVSSISAGKAATLAGLGILNLPLGEIEEDLASGALVEVLPDWSPPQMGIYAVWPDSGPKKNLTRRLIDFLATRQTPHGT